MKIKNNILIEEKRDQGFFSCFNLILCGINKLNNSGRNNIYIDWRSNLYQTSDYNLFDKFFWKQEKKRIEYDEIYSAFDLMYDTNINKKLTKETDLSHSEFANRSLLETLEKNNFFTNETYIKCFEKSIKSENTLGVHVRKTDSTYHRSKKEFIEDDYYFEEINKIDFKYEKIFIATDDTNSLNNFKNKYKDKLIYNENVSRTTGKIGVHNCGFQDKEKLAEDVFIDALSLRNCDTIVGTQSNILTFISILDPKINFKRIDLHIQYDSYLQY